MAKISDTKLRSNLREKITKEIFETLADSGEDVMMTKSNQFCFPCVDENGGEWFARVTIEIPTGSREDHEPYDGYAMAETYQINLKEKAEKAEIEKKKKEEKAKKDAEIRQKKKENAEKAKQAKVSE